MAAGQGPTHRSIGRGTLVPKGKQTAALHPLGPLAGPNPKKKQILTGNSFEKQENHQNTNHGV